MIFRRVVQGGDGVDKVDVLEVKRVQQKEAHCGPASIEMLFSFYGLNVTQEEVVAAVGLTETIVRDGGTRIDQLAQAVRVLHPEYALLARYNCSLRDMKHILEEFQIPVGVEWRGLFLEPNQTYVEKGHYSVITLLDDLRGVIYIADPEQKNVLTPNGEISMVEFEQRWWEINDVPRLHDPTQIEFIRNERLIFVLVKEQRQEALRNLGFQPATLSLMWRYRVPDKSSS